MKLRVQELRLVRGGRTVLDGVDLSLEQGEVLALVGPNGAGKTSFLHALGGLLAPARGEVELDGRRVSPRELRRRTAMVFQEQLLLSGSVRFNVEVGPAVRGAGRAERRRRADRWLEVFRLAGLAGRDARTLSGGEAQRVNLARAFALEPDVLLLDEPLDGLDAPTRASLLEEIRQALRGAGTTAVFVTHHPDEVRNLAGRAGVLLAGRLAQVAGPRELYDRPRTPAVAAFLGLGNIRAGLVEAVEESRIRVRLADGTRLAIGPEDSVAEGLEPRPGLAVTVRLRPEELVVRPAADGRGWPGRIGRVEAEGALYRVEVRGEAGSVHALLRPREKEALDGERVRLEIPPGAAHLMPAGPSGA